MILHTGNPIADTADPLHGVIQQIDMRQLQSCPRKAVGIYRVGMILACHLNFPGEKIFHRVIAPAMSEFQLIRLGAVSQTDNLMSQTNTEDRQFSAQLLYQCNYRFHIFGIPRSVG